MPETKITPEQLVEKRNSLMKEIWAIRDFQLNGLSYDQKQNFGYFLHSIPVVAKAYDQLDANLIGIYDGVVTTVEEADAVIEKAMEKINELKEDCQSENGGDWEYMKGKWGR